MRKYLRELRTKKEICQQFVANEIGVTRQYYSQIENGNRQKRMNISMANKLAKVFGVSPSYIIEEESKLAQVE